MPSPTDAEVAAATGCTPGAQNLLANIQAKWPNTTNMGCYVKRTVREGSSWSYHAVGRAIDVGNTTAIMQQIADAMIKTSGIEEVIFNRKIWSLEKNVAGWRPYTGDSPHTDHVHIGVSKEFGGAIGGNPSVQLDPITILPINNIRDLIGDFPDPKCTYTFGETKDGKTLSQETAPYIETENKKVIQAPCSNEEDLKIFPAFDSDCWVPYYLPKLEYQNDLTCYCQPMITNNHCCKWTNNAIYDAEGTFTLKVGNKDIRNVRVTLWTEPLSKLESPCENLDFWLDREPQFSLEIPHLPKGSTYRKTPTDHIIIFANRTIEPAIKYVTGGGGGDMGSLFIESCSTGYFLLEFDCINTASNAEFDLGYSHRYLSSG